MPCMKTRCEAASLAVLLFSLAVASEVFAGARGNTDDAVSVPKKVAVLLRPILDLENDSLRLCRSTKPQSCTEGWAYEEDLARSKQKEQLITELLQKHD